MGSGGTLDPLADGVLGWSIFRYHYITMNQDSYSMAVIGVGSGTKDLGQFIECTKVRLRRYFFHRGNKFTL